ncbi:MAG TPA: dihydrodipicolinate synthase family protein [Acidimicrobiales bacterium]|nr:dihydrodipicolinate synthase family protein [Acidimicrobiales bacterium]
MTGHETAVDRLQPRREIKGHAALLLPHDLTGSVDWESFDALLSETLAAGLVPAVNMDTGFTQLLDDATRREVLEVTARVAGSDFLAGAFVGDTAGDPHDPDAYLRALHEVIAAGGTPVVFPSHGLNALDPDGWVAAHRRFGEESDAYLAFELGDMFVDYGRIYPLESYAELLGISACIGAKHSSLSRRAEWDRLALRDAHRPEFLVLTGNDLAIDMVCWGSDYLLGLATFAPDAFARRDAYWTDGDDRFYELNDVLQALGAFAFRAPVPAYRHDAAMFLALRGKITHDAVPAGCPRRGETDREALAGFAARLEELL